MQIYPNQPEHIPMAVSNESNLRLLMDFLSSH